jgi:hypothetical protein
LRERLVAAVVIFHMVKEFVAGEPLRQEISLRGVSTSADSACQGAAEAGGLDVQWRHMLTVVPGRATRTTPASSPHRAHRLFPAVGLDDLVLVSTAATVLADVLGSAAAGDAAGIAGNALGLVAAVIALSRKRTEDKDGHRTQG